MRGKADGFGRGLPPFSRNLGLGNASVWATDSLTATVNGAGNVTYIGNPPKIVSNVHGTGAVGRKTDLIRMMGVGWKSDTVIAHTEPELFGRLVERCARAIFPQCEATARALPGHLWRICGSEYASEPYLPAHLYDEYVVKYTGRMVKMIQEHGGYARIHSHGRLRNILPLIAKMEPAGLDPLEPPPQGDMELREIRKAIGRQTVLFGNLEASDLENLQPADFKKKIEKALKEGADGKGRGFVLMPSACPYGRIIKPNTMRNYELMVEAVGAI